MSGIPLLTDEQIEVYPFMCYSRGLYVFSYVDIVSVQVGDGYGNSRLTGEKKRVQKKWSVLAPNQEYADFAFADYFGQSAPVEVTCEMIPVCAHINRMGGK